MIVARESSQKFAAACQREGTKRVAERHATAKGATRKRAGEREWSGELTPVTRGGCNHVSAVPCFLDWTVSPVPSRWSPFSRPPVLLSHARANACTHAQTSLGRSFSVLFFPRSPCPPSLFVSLSRTHTYILSLSPTLSC